MTNQKTVEEIVDEFDKKFVFRGKEGRYCVVKLNDLMNGEEAVDWLTQTLQAERQKREQELQKAREEAQEEYKQFVLNVLDGVDIADGQCSTKAIRFALQSRTIQSELDQPK
jgi:Skp family chaperone for outer membrane proteins